MTLWKLKGHQKFLKILTRQTHISSWWMKYWSMLNVLWNVKMSYHGKYFDITCKVTTQDGSSHPISSLCATSLPVSLKAVTSKIIAFILELEIAAPLKTIWSNFWTLLGHRVYIYIILPLQTILLSINYDYLEAFCIIFAGVSPVLLIAYWMLTLLTLLPCLLKRNVNLKPKWKNKNTRWWLEKWCLN